jgi:hypothetical protein
MRSVSAIPEEVSPDGGPPDGRLGVEAAIPADIGVPFRSITTVAEVGAVVGTGMLPGSRVEREQRIRCDRCQVPVMFDCDLIFLTPSRRIKAHWRAPPAASGHRTGAWWVIMTA